MVRNGASDHRRAFLTLAGLHEINVMYTVRTQNSRTDSPGQNYKRHP